MTNVHELPDENLRNGTNLTLSARIDALEAETQQLKALTQARKLSHGILVVSVMTMNLSGSTQALYRMKFSWPSEFLGPSVDQGENIPSCKHTKLKLDPLNQLFLTLVKLCLNLQERDLACRFGISISLISRCFSI